MGARNCEELGVNLQKIVNRLLANDDLLKLLYYTDQDPLNPQKITPDKMAVFEEYLRVTPRAGTKDSPHAVAIIYIMRAGKLYGNKEFKNVQIKVDVIVPLTQWAIMDTNFRMFAILGRIQESLDGKTINGLGKIVGGDFELNYGTDEVICYQQTFELTEYD